MYDLHGLQLYISNSRQPAANEKIHQPVKKAKNKKAASDVSLLAFMSHMDHFAQKSQWDAQPHELSDLSSIKYRCSPLYSFKTKFVNAFQKEVVADFVCNDNGFYNNHVRTSKLCSGLDKYR